MSYSAVMDEFQRQPPLFCELWSLVPVVGWRLSSHTAGLSSESGIVNWELARCARGRWALSEAIALASSGWTVFLGMTAVWYWRGHHSRTVGDQLLGSGCFDFETLALGPVEKHKYEARRRLLFNYALTFQRPCRAHEVPLKG